MYNEESGEYIEIETMYSMEDAEAIIHAIDIRLMDDGNKDEDYLNSFVEGFTETIYFFREEGNLDAFMDICKNLYESMGGNLEEKLPAAPQRENVGPLLHTWRMMFSSG
ncbi:MAG: hypothetical protein EXR59_00290 [Dehalococcoidia bacterium]|nr:hypothetical protein [Dehalococcoidia bacterium]